MLKFFGLDMIAVNVGGAVAQIAGYSKQPKNAEGPHRYQAQKCVKVPAARP